MMDLTKTAPRSVKETMLGIVQLARTTDKAKAVAHGSIGEYHYDCSMDQGLFEYLHMDAKASSTSLRKRRAIPRSKRTRRRSSTRRILAASKPSTRSGSPRYRPENR